MADGGAPRIVILGGGIAGLSAAFRLKELSAKHDAPLEVTLMERGLRLGGALRTIREQGFIAEAGADSFLTEKPWALDLVRRLGLDGELIATRAEFRRTYVVRNGALAEIPEGFSLLAPTRMLPMLRSPLLSPLGKFRVMLEPLIPRRRGHRDESLASFVTRRLGREVLERIAQPLAGGIYTADPEHLSLHATLPRFADMEARYGSVIRGLRAAARKQGAESSKTGGASGARWSLFASLRGGVSTLVDALAQRLGESVRHNVEAMALERIDGGGAVARRPRWRVVDTGQPVVSRTTPAILRAPGLSRSSAIRKVIGAACPRARDDRLCVGGGGQPGLSGKRFSACAAKLRLRRSRARAPQNHRRQLHQPEVRRPRAGRNDPGACVRRRRDAKRIDGP